MDLAKRSFRLEYIQESTGGERLDMTSINNSFVTQRVETKGHLSLLEAELIF